MLVQNVSVGCVGAASTLSSRRKPAAGMRLNVPDAGRMKDGSSCFSSTYDHKVDGWLHKRDRMYFVLEVVA